MTDHKKLTDIFSMLDGRVELESLHGLKVTSPWTGKNVAHIETDTAQTLNEKLGKASAAQARFSALKRSERAALVQMYGEALKAKKDELASVIQIEAGKTPKEAGGEAGASGDVLLKTIADTTLEDSGGMQRTKERPAAGIVGLITSFNFPMAVAHWTAGAAFLAGNAIVWKPSEKTPLSALACKAIFDKAVPGFSDLFQIVIGERDIGEALVAHEDVDIISATGSVAMGQGIKATLKHKKNNALAPILELGGNNGVIITSHVTSEHLAMAVSGMMQSFLGTTGQRCTNTRRIFVHQSKHDELVALFTGHIEAFLKEHFKDGAFDQNNAAGYGALIDEDAFKRFEQAKNQAEQEEGTVIFGSRLAEESLPDAYYIEPTLALMPEQTAVMHTETFAPLLYIVPYEGDVQTGIELLNEPENAGLVGGVYTLSQNEADEFARHCDAGHALINSSKGTGTPAYGMGFGGNKESGCGEILNGADPLAPFTRPGQFTRIAQNTEVKMQE